MVHPFLRNTSKTIQYVLLWIVYALIHVLVMSRLVVLPGWVLWVDGFTEAVLFGTIGLVLWVVVKFGNFGALTLYQRLVNQVALAVLSLLLWIGIDYVVILVTAGTETLDKLNALIPVRGLIGLLLYINIMLYFRLVTGFAQPSADENQDQSSQPEEKTLPKQSDAEVMERVAVKSGSKIHVVLVQDIFYLQADGDYVHIFSKDGKYLKEQTMKYFEEHLPANQFVRVHRSVIVNVEMISRIELYEKQNQLLTLKNGQQIKTSPAGYKALRATLNL